MADAPAPYRRKLIEVSIPLDAINAASATEKSIRHGHPSTLHLWWSRKPLATSRAVLFASLVDDPSSRPDEFPTEETQAAERERLFEIIRKLVKWENSNDRDVLAAARAEIVASCDDELPPVLDPFAGGGSIPLEAQRLGLEAHASDLNPVAVLINKAMIEIPPRFAGQPPVHPGAEHGLKTWAGAQGLADDVRHYGAWMRDRAKERIGHLYPEITLPDEHGGGEAAVIAWIWARTVECPNPACGVVTPLVSSWMLSTKKGRERWIAPTVENGRVRYEITGPQGEPPGSVKHGQGAKFSCVACGTIIRDAHTVEQVSNRAHGDHLMAVVAAGNRSRIYAPADDVQRTAANVDRPKDVPDQKSRGTFGGNAQGRRYCFHTFADYFMNRQLVALSAFSDLVGEAREKIRAEALAARLPDSPTDLRDGGTGASAYAEAVAVYLSFAVDKCIDYSSTMTTWNSHRDGLRSTFQVQGIQMPWGYAEANLLSNSTGSLEQAIKGVVQVLECLPARHAGIALQLDARAVVPQHSLVSTDPPYYSNMGYSDTSDFFYVWLRRMLGTSYPEECSTLLVPKSQELVANAYRFGGDRRKADDFFESGLGDVFERLHAAQDRRFPLTIYYAFKQAETTDGATASTGWETMLHSLIDAGFLIDGTWPMRSERGGRMVSIGTNALASSIVLVCRHRAAEAALGTRKEFIATLKSRLPDAVKTLQQGSIAPVDLAQAAIGPGMAVFSAYSKVVEADGSAMRVRTALELINQVLDDAVAGSDAAFDADTRWAVTWFEEHAMSEGAYGSAEQLSKSRNTSVAGLKQSGIIAQRPGKVRLVPRDDLPDTWHPSADARLTVWEVTQHLIRRLETDGEPAAAALLATIGSGYGETAKELAYRLYLICDREGWAKEATSYNALVTAWPELTKLAAAPLASSDAPDQQRMF